MAEPEGLRLERLAVERGGFRLAADLAVSRGARVAVIGPSGGGKSTLLLAIAGFLDPAAGRILWDGTDITWAAPGERPFTILFQDVNLLPALSVFQNVALGLSSRLRPSPAERQRIEDALAEVGLAGLGQRRPSELSGGQQGRVALARALLRARPVLLLDEPFAALGPALRAEMLALTARVLDRTGAMLLMVTHEPRDALAICGETIVVAEGRAAPPVATGALLADPPPALAAYLGTR